MQRDLFTGDIEDGLTVLFDEGKARIFAAPQLTLLIEGLQPLIAAQLLFGLR